MKFLLAGGGTAGHIEPALAVGRGLKERYPDSVIEFVGTSSGLETTLIPNAGFTLRLIPKVAIARRISPSLLTVPFQLARSIRASLSIVKGRDCVIGFGGYVSAPIYIAAALTRTPFVIHEQNAHPGWANRMGARFTKYLAISYPIDRGRLSRAALTGLPLRDDVSRLVQQASRNWSSARELAKARVAEQYDLRIDQPLVFIFGGSQGSQAINRTIESARTAGVFGELSVVHGVGRNNPLPSADHSYRPLAYVEGMADLYLAADLVIARSGAVTCAEFAALGRYALFIPLPIGNGEQALNAQSLIAQGRASILNQSQFTPEWLSKNLGDLLERSAVAEVEGDAAGLASVDKILALIDSATGGK